MEASQAGLGGQGGQGEGQGSEGAQQGQQQAPAGLGFDPGDLIGALAEVQQGQEGLRELLQAQQQAGQEEVTPGEQALDLGFLDPMSGLDPEQMGQQLNQVISQQATSIAERMLQERLGPVQQQLTDMNRDTMIRDLQAEFPEFEQREVAQEVVGNGMQTAEAYGWGQEIGQDPRFWRLVHLANRALQSAHEEGQMGQDPGTALLEGGRGPGPAQVPVDLGEQIVNGGGRRGAGVLPFG